MKTDYFESVGARTIDAFLPSFVFPAAPSAIDFCGFLSFVPSPHHHKFMSSLIRSENLLRDWNLNAAKICFFLSNLIRCCFIFLDEREFNMKFLRRQQHEAIGKQARTSREKLQEKKDGK